MEGWRKRGKRGGPGNEGREREIRGTQEVEGNVEGTSNFTDNTASPWSYQLCWCPKPRYQGGRGW